MNTTVNPPSASIGSLITERAKSPLFLLAAAFLIVCVLLALPLVVPIGPMYWDVLIYYDASNRIFEGQVPVIDFFTPVGPLGYYLFAGWVTLFPNAQPALLAHWSLLLVTAPLMALVLWDVGQRSRGIGFAVLVPFLVFVLLPFNTREFYPFPGSDAFGIYNRQVCQMLYVLVAALMFVRNRYLLVALVALIMTALFFLKITGFVAGGVIAAYAFFAGRVKFRYALEALTIFAIALAVIELASGMVSQYVMDVLRLVQMNSGTLLPRFLQSASINFGVVLAASALAIVLLWSDRQKLLERFSSGRKTSLASAVSTVLDHHGLWLFAVVFAGILFETQNTGSQAFIFLAPLVVAILLKAPKLLGKPVVLLSVLGLSAAIVLPPALFVIERAARTYIGSVKNQPLAQRNLRTLGAVNMRSEVAVRAEHMLNFYPEHRSLYTDLTNAGELPTPVLYSDYDFQITYLGNVDAAIDSIRKLESDKGIRFDTLMSLNFVNPFPWLMDRSAPLHIAIGADPTRAVPDPGSTEEGAVAQADLILLPTCPPTTANAMLYDMYKSALTQHRRIQLDACYDAFVHPRFFDALDR
ncbi:hypothetical protein [Aminobacter sp. AP02]|uniref:hypothetical protein n=1 Tax=Aminobacter sp. AP02 TaxID=2135737 RepID=UPI000D6D6EE5|nr:hypothetical protein [Aminobacter sp. AP02]PWK69110.1 hypothetical protein C8K44_109140 [Aminobacter sp. AP02]